MIFISCSLGYCLVTFFAENLATFLEIFFSNQDINTIFFLAVFYFLRFASFFERFFGFWILLLQIILADKKLCKFKQSFINSYIFILQFGSIFMFDGCCKIVDQLGLCMYRNSCLKYCISVK